MNKEEKYKAAIEQAVFSFNDWRGEDVACRSLQSVFDDLAKAIEPPFVPEAGKVYCFSDYDSADFYGIFKFIDPNGKYAAIGYDPWDNCRPLTPEEIGK